MIAEMHKDTRHTFNVVFNARHVTIENAYTFEVYPIYWQTEVITGYASLVGSLSFTPKIHAFLSGSGTSITRGYAELKLSGSFIRTSDISATAYMSASSVPNASDPTLEGIYK